MALGDGTTWDETTPTDGTDAVQIDDYNRDLRKGMRNRMAIEHEWPSSQSATSEAGQHKFITLQEQAAKPTVSGTQLAAVYVKTVAAGEQEMFFEDESGNEEQLSNVGSSVDARVKAWVVFDGTGTPTIADSYNVDSITDNGTGDYTINWTVPFASADYVVSGSASLAATTCYFVISPDAAPLAGAVRIKTTNTSNEAVDATAIMVMAIGEQ